MEKTKKFRLTEETMQYDGVELHRIEALVNIKDCLVTPGSKGGWVESESNLSQEGLAWIGYEAKVMGEALVSENACVTDHAVVTGKARVYGRACVAGYAIVSHNARVCDISVVKDNSKVYHNARVQECACVEGNVIVSGDAVVGGYATVKDRSLILCKTVVCGNVQIKGKNFFTGDAVISHPWDYITFKNHFSSFRHFTWTRSNNKWSVGCFHGTDEELIAKSRVDSEAKGEYYKAYVDFKNRLLELDEKYNIAGAKDKQS